eukprot:jgi/Botrbrau1/1061/Bobra.0076s0027.1
MHVLKTIGNSKDAGGKRECSKQSVQHEKTFYGELNAIPQTILCHLHITMSEFTHLCDLCKAILYGLR